MACLYVMGGAALVYLAFRLYSWLQSRETIPSLHTRHIFITGCDSGFGRLLARRLDRMGCHVFAACLTSSAANELANETSERVKTVIMDVTKDEDIERAFKEVKEALPANKGLWGLMNNAGIFGPAGNAEMMTRKEFRIPYEVNVLGLAEVTRVFLPLVRKERGRIVNTTSATGRFALSPAPYVASKFAAVGYTDQLRRELYMHDITVHSIEPGAFLTNLISTDTISRSVTRIYQQSSPYVQKLYGQDYPQKYSELIKLFNEKVASRDPEEVVDAYVHALTSKRPAIAYTVGWSGHYVYGLMNKLPTWLSDWLLTRGIKGPAEVPEL